MYPVLVVCRLSQIPSGKPTGVAGSRTAEAFSTAASTGLPASTANATSVAAVRLILLAAVVARRPSPINIVDLRAREVSSEAAPPLRCWAAGVALA